MQRVLCIWLPGWPLQRQVATRPELRADPLALYARDSRRGQLVVECSSAAYQRGIRPGMPLAEAQALVGGERRVEGRRSKVEGRNLKVEVRNYRPTDHRPPTTDPQSTGCFCRHDPLADREALTELAIWCEQFSPVVGLETECEPSCLLLDITGLAALFDGEAVLAEWVVSQFRQRGYEVRCGVADTVGAAWAAARFGRYLDDTTSANSPLRLVPPGAGLSPLGPLPLSALRLPDGTRGLLHSLGITSVRQLTALPRADLSSRLGNLVVQRLGQAEGTIKEVIVAVRPPPKFHARWALHHPTHRQTVIREVLDQLIRRVAASLVNENRGAVQLECRLVLLRESLPSTAGSPTKQDDRCGKLPIDRSHGRRDREVVLRVGLFQPTAVADHLCQLVCMQLEQTRLPGLVEEVEVQAVTTARLVARQQQMFSQSGTGDPRQVTLLVDRLAGRLGQDRVVGVQLQLESQVERAFRYHPLVGSKKGTHLFSTPSHRIRQQKRCVPSFFLRPLRLAVPPPAIEVVAVAPGGPPIRFQACGQVYRVQRHWGPERIETGWWRGHCVRRDYYRVETTTGQRFWLFRRLEDGRWYLQGTFE